MLLLVAWHFQRAGFLGAAGLLRRSTMRDSIWNRIVLAAVFATVSLVGMSMPTTAQEQQQQDPKKQEETKKSQDTKKQQNQKQQEQNKQQQQHVQQQQQQEKNKQQQQRVQQQQQQEQNNQQQQRVQQQQQQDQNRAQQQQQQEQNNQQQQRVQQQQQQEQNRQQQQQVQQQQQQEQNRQQQQQREQNRQQQQQADNRQQQRLSQQQQQQLVAQQQQRMTQYRQHVDQEVRIAPQRIAQLQQQKRTTQYRYQQEYLNRLNQQHQSIQNDRNHDYYNDPYFYTAPNYRYNRGGRYYQTNQYGANLLRQAVNYGYAEGFHAGEADRMDHWRFSYQDSFAYQDANYGYNGYYVDRADYNYYFRKGFSRGYNDGYYNHYQYGHIDNGTYRVLEGVLGGILILDAITH
jgi:hypothetical protein